jgi:hypothetical protein
MGAGSWLHRIERNSFVSLVLYGLFLPWVAVLLHSHFFVTQETGMLRQDRLDNDAWVIPMYSSRRNQWLLGVIDWRRKRLWYVDGRPLHSKTIRDQGDAWTWTVSVTMIVADWFISRSILTSY